MKLSATRKTRTAEINLGDGQSFTITYRSFSPDEWDRLEEDTADEKWRVAIQLSKLLVSTGLEDDDDSPIAPTVENLRRIESPILTAMLRAIVGTTLPKKES